ncbi:MAG: nitrogen fixation protein NifH [Chloroflexi bacterium]|nr:nitrogen fixation protein NifH [Chloroflexota bacterium]
MSWQDQLKGDAVSWLLEPESPGVRYLALRDLLELPPTDPELCAARKTAHEKGPIATILDGMDAAGYWVAPGPGYNPKYRSTVWSVIMLAQLGACIQADQRIAWASAYLLDHALTAGGHFTASGAPSGTADCLQGNLCWALVELGCDDPRLELAYAWMARSVTGEGVAPATDRQAAVRYYAGKCGPTFACGSNNTLPCAWGAAKVILAFSKWHIPTGSYASNGSCAPNGSTGNRELQTPLISRAIQHGVDFLFSVDPATAGYPNGYSAKPSQNWWKFGFPVFYVTDLLQIVEALVGLGYGDDPRLAHALAIICDKQDAQGRWPLEYDYAGKTWVDFGAKKQPNKWVTLRALRVLKAAAA